MFPNRAVGRYTRVVDALLVGAVLRILEITNNMERPGMHEPAEGINDHVLFNGDTRVILERSPDLVQLHLENALRSGGNFYQDCEKLHLPSLVRLSITAPVSEITTLLSYVDIPLMAQVRLRCQQSNRSRADDFIPFCTFLSQWFGTSTSFIPIRSSGIEN